MYGFNIYTYMGLEKANMDVLVLATHVANCIELWV